VRHLLCSASSAGLRLRALPSSIGRVETRRGPDGRLRKPDKQARVRALQQAWDPEARVFRCHYTSIELITDPGCWRDHRYLSFEH